MLRHYLIYIAIKLFLVLTNIFMFLSKYAGKVPHYDMWSFFVTSIVSIIYGEYVDDIVLKLINFAVLGFFIAMYSLGYYQQFKNKLISYKEDIIIAIDFIKKLIKKIN